MEEIPIKNKFLEISIIFRSLFIDSDNLPLIERQQRDHSKVSTFRSLERIMYLNRIHPDQQISTMKAPLASIPIVIYTRKNFFLLDALNKKIDTFKAAGLIDYWFLKEYDIANATTMLVEGPKQLTVHKLAGCFKILGLGCGISLVVFIVEFIAQRKLKI